MKIFLKDKKLGSENYQYNVWINEKKVDTCKMEHGGLVCVECPEGCDVRIEVENILFRDKKIYLLFVFYWIVSFFSGCSECSPFGYPFNAIIKINNVGKKDIFLETNSIWKKNAFKINTNCSVAQNNFYSPKGYKRKWLLGFAVPVLVLILAFLILLIMLEVKQEFIAIKNIFMITLLAVEFIWVLYIVRVLNLNKDNI